MKRVGTWQAAGISLCVLGLTVWARADVADDQPLFLQIANPADTVRGHSTDNAGATSRESAVPADVQPTNPAGERLRSFELPAVTVYGEPPPELKEELVGVSGDSPPFRAYLVVGYEF